MLSGRVRKERDMVGGGWIVVLVGLAGVGEDWEVLMVFNWWREADYEGIGDPRSWSMQENS